MPSISLSRAVSVAFAASQTIGNYSYATDPDQASSEAAFIATVRMESKLDASTVVAINSVVTLAPSSSTLFALRKRLIASSSMDSVFNYDISFIVGQGNDYESADQGYQTITTMITNSVDSGNFNKTLIATVMSMSTTSSLIYSQTTETPVWGAPVISTYGIYEYVKDLLNIGAVIGGTLGATFFCVIVCFIYYYRKTSSVMYLRNAIGMYRNKIHPPSATAAATVSDEIGNPLQQNQQLQQSAIEMKQVETLLITDENNISSPLHLQESAAAIDMNQVDTSIVSGEWTEEVSRTNFNGLE